MRLSLHIPFFRIFYSSTYTILVLFLFFLLAATPGDHIYQTISNHKIGNVFVVAGVYVVTGLIAIFIYANRLYTNRVALAAIPRWYLPIQKGEVSKGVFRLICRNRQRSALIAWDTRPRDLNVEPSTQHSEARDAGAAGQRLSHDALRFGGTRAADQSIATRGNHRLHVDSSTTIHPVSPDSPPWGQLSHPGWSSPSSSDLPNLHFETVLRELPNLLEAKAVSLAPADRALSFPSQPQGGAEAAAAAAATTTTTPDPQAVAILQRPPNMFLRAYLTYLAEVGVVAENDGATVASFLDTYEFARFSACALTELEFRELMRLFSELLVALRNVPEGFPADAINDPERFDGGKGLGLGGDDEDVDVTSLMADSSTDRLHRELSNTTSPESAGSTVLR